MTLPSSTRQRPAKREAGNRARRVAAHAGQLRRSSTRAGKLPSNSAHDHLRGAVQVARAAVVAEALPQLEHIVQRRGGQRLHGGEAHQETLVVGDHGRDLRLLQHDFRQPDGVRVARCAARAGRLCAPRTRLISASVQGGQVLRCPIMSCLASRAL